MLPTFLLSLNREKKIAIFTANSDSLDKVKEELREQCGLDIDNMTRIIIVGCQNVPYFGEALENGTKVPVDKVIPEMRKLARDVVKENKGTIAGILFECTELPPYSDTVRDETGLPVWDAITACNAFMAGSGRSTFPEN